LRKRPVEAGARLKRLFDAIESGVAELADPMLKDRIAELKAARDQARLIGVSASPFGQMLLLGGGRRQPLHRAMPARRYQVRCGVLGRAARLPINAPVVEEGARDLGQ
jgi:hypothetical protein